MNNDLDKKIEESLVEMSQFNQGEKDQIWNTLEKELFNGKQRETKLKKKGNKLGYLTAAAALLFILFGVQTETGSALVDKVKALFEPEKEVKQSIEGTEEETNLHLKEGKESQYIIYIDEERYKLENTESGDIIKTKEPLDERYPEVSMTITQIKDERPATLYTKLKEKLLVNYPTIILEEEVTTPEKGFMLFVKKNGTGWDNELTKLYVVDNQRTGSFVIQQKYFAEAEEGHGARFDYMLREFQIISE